MKTKSTPSVRQLVLTALFLALAFVLPLLTGQVPKVGNMLCPMHFPVLLCGFVLGGPWGLAVGFAAPLLRSVLFGMPPMFPVAISMAFELATYGLVSGLLWRKAKHTLPALYAVLLTAMVSGRIVWGIVRFVLAGLTGALLAQQDDVATTGETVASAAYLHGLAAAIASESEQQGWQEPELIGREHRQRFMTLGHPIVAGDVAHAIPEAIADVIA